MDEWYEYNKRYSKVKAVLEAIRPHTHRLVDDFGNPLGLGDIVALLGLGDVLTDGEQILFMMELRDLMEAQKAADQVKSNMF